MDDRKARTVKGVRRRTFGPLTDLGADRRRNGLKLFDVARAAGISTYRVSVIERGVDDGTPEEISLLRAAIARLARERGQEPPR